ncbi:hypothetical protein GCM10007853_09930 [Algimonas ampicilliniresistens]|uniref:DUF975 family protein n=1 Tax=Algimonas ampicilliniresistens TaxID=1298735 RepID=A0ABQ5V6H5_9PROT|nr:hypothetical protein [Algimonas ampicilliniresistens]GLQ23119.1 hypothetical protein GCM10007853_09930 [Algimonas ampicilliniresistens]
MSPIEPTPYSKDYEITDAMFGAFRTSGGMVFFWKLTVWAALFYTALFIALVPPLVRAYGDMIMVVSLDSEAEATAQIIGTVFNVLIMALLFAIGAFLVQAVVRAAFYRGYFDGDVGGIFPFQFGADEVRQALAIMGYYAIVTIFISLATVALALIVALIAALGGDSGGPIAAILFIIGYVAIMVGYIWIMTIYAPAGALTAWRGKTHVLAARYVTHGRFWAIFGSVLVAGLVGYVAYTVLASIGMMVGLAGLFNAEILGAFIGDTPEDVIPALIEQTKAPGFMVGVIFAALLTALGSAIYMVMIAGPQAFFTYQWAEAADDLANGET